MDPDDQLALKGLASEGLDIAAPRIQKLLGVLHNTRVRRFIKNLEALCEDDRTKAEIAFRKSLQHASGPALIKAIAQECLFGSETISLAALAVLVSRERLGLFEDLPVFSIKAVNGLLNTDALLFLALVSRVTGQTDLPDTSGDIVYKDLVIADLDKEQWDNERTLLTLSTHSVISAIGDLTARRLLIQDIGGRMDRAGRVSFGVTGYSLTFYGLLHRAASLVEAQLLHGLGVRTPEDVLQRYKLRS